MVSGVVIVSLIATLSGTAEARSMGTPLPQGWESQILASLGAPITQNNVKNLDAWQAAEGGSTANPDAYNPFDTAYQASWLPGQHGTSYGTNSANIQHYSDWQTGLEATVSTIEQQNMAPILHALQGDVQLPQFAAAVGSTHWGSNPSNIAAYKGGGSVPVVDLTGAQLTSKLLPPTPQIPFPHPAGTSTITQDVTNPIGQLVGGPAGDFLKSLITSGLVMKGTLIVAGLVILFIGLSQVTKVDGAGGTIASGTQEVKVHVISGARKVAK